MSGFYKIKKYLLNSEVGHEFLLNDLVSCIEIKEQSLHDYLRRFTSAGYLKRRGYLYVVVKIPSITLKIKDL